MISIIGFLKFYLPSSEFPLLTAKKKMQTNYPKFFYQLILDCILHISKADLSTYD